MQHEQTREANTRLQHHGKGGELFVIFIVNLVYRILTLGIYHFWAKTRVRRYAWSQTSFDGERFEYTGQGKELFLGFLKFLGGVLIFAVAVVVLSAILQFLTPGMSGVLPIFLVPFYIYIIGVGLYGAAQYTLGHSRWRSIRFGVDGSAWTYGWKFLGNSILLLLTLGFYEPFMHNNLTHYQLNNMAFGSQRFNYHGDGRALFPKYLLALLLALPTLGLSFVWYSAAKMRYTAQQTQLGSLSFESDVTGGKLLVFMLVNLLMIVLSLGLAFPWVVVRNFEFACRHMSVTGQLDYDRIQQSETKQRSSGEGLAEALNLGGI